MFFGSELTLSLHLPVLVLGTRSLKIKALAGHWKFNRIVFRKSFVYFSNLFPPIPGFNGES